MFKGYFFDKNHQQATMTKSTFTESQIVFSIQQSETGTPVSVVFHKMGFNSATFYNWKKKYDEL